MAKDIKVYELAKTLGVKSVFLMDKIRKEWNLPIKSHMETLSPEMVEKIQKNFSSETSKPAAKKTTTKKTVTKKSAAKKPAVKKTTTKKTVTKKTSSAKPAATKADSKPKARIIRRRKEDQAVIKPVEVKTQQTETDAQTQTVVRKAPIKNIRSDLVSVQKSNSFKDIFLDEKPQEDKKQDFNKPKKSFVEKDVSKKFNSTDFRKREMIFQPKKKKILAGDFKKTQITTPKANKRILKVHGEMKVDTVCKKMGIKRSAFVKKLKSEGIDTSDLNTLDFDTIALVVGDFGFEAKNVKQTEQDMIEIMTEETTVDPKDLSSKPPVVTIMGHVDHGKTTLLDTIRKTKVVEGEAGGITQHIGAYSVNFNNKDISFIDTPGHEAFTAMRARGAKVTDIVVIVVAATDGVMPQTVESINHAKAADIPMIVAITKMDAQGANPDKVKQQMSEHEIISEDWGGTTSFIPVAALKGEGIKDLLEQINLIAEVQELKCQKKGLAKGVVLEARMEKGRGCVASLLVQDGTLKSGDSIVAGQVSGRVRQMKNDSNKVIKEVFPGFPVEIIGLDGLPEAGDSFHIVKNEKALKELMALRKQKQQSEDAPKPLTVEELLEKTYSEQQNKELNLIIKTDVRGSLEAIKTSLEKLNNEETSIKVVHSGTGAITESDILLASTVSGTVIGFNVRPDNKASQMARQKSIDIKTYSIIYELLDEMKKLLLGMLDPEFVEEETGKAEVRDVFHISKLGTVAGCYVTSGKIQRNNLVRLVRDGRLVHEGNIHSLRRFKDDAKEVSSGFECGIVIENFNDIKPKDVLETYIKKEVPRTEMN